ncbi:protein-glutamate O-methyltransferase CheR [Salipiger sp. PrR002]|uniref:CheR family methyltransferase n=1 Tax=Salipiger sp. PrR002 TaxID=2706489 RepID=UPI0013BC2D36|nr:CheR family methyltransferase [Salipiger sp. PrR002]NDW00817.1 chemotaxis protein [Salipiger sp. PrR002]NDW59628.1 chemotaxis protein [Salipiger sp. PrR004]
MSLAATAEMPEEFSFSDADFEALARLARAEFGLSLAASKKPLVYSRLARRLRARSLSSFHDYMKLVDCADEVDERLELVSALTTNVTSFFREKHHFDTLRDVLMPELAKQRRVRIWSAGCSSGPEPFSIAMTLLDGFSSLPPDLRILATDIDPAILRRARRGRYPREDCSAVPPPFQSRWLSPASGEPEHVEVSQDLKRIISFAELNLICDWPFKGPFDAIFCRNVAIYFDQDTQQRLWTRFSAMLRAGGFLFIGHSERLSGPAAHEFATAGVTTYRKRVLPVSAQPT